MRKKKRPEDDKPEKVSESLESLESLDSLDSLDPLELPDFELEPFDFDAALKDVPVENLSLPDDLEALNLEHELGMSLFDSHDDAPRKDAPVEEVAAWLLEQAEKHKVLYHHHAVQQVREVFGTQHLAHNRSRNLVLSPLLIKVFRRLSPGLVWERHNLCWRKRIPSDGPSRQV